MRTLFFSIGLTLLAACAPNEQEPESFTARFLPTNVQKLGESPYDFRAFVLGAQALPILTSDDPDGRILKRYEHVNMASHLQDFLRKEFIPSAEVIEERIEFVRAVPVTKGQQPKRMDTMYLHYQVNGREIMIAKAGSRLAGKVAFTFCLKGEEQAQAESMKQAKTLVLSTLDKYFVPDSDAPFDLHVVPSKTAEGILLLYGRKPEKQAQNYRQAMYGILCKQAVTLIFEGHLFYPNRSAPRPKAGPVPPDRYFDHQAEGWRQEEQRRFLRT